MTETELKEKLFDIIDNSYGRDKHSVNSKNAMTEIMHAIQRFSKTQHDKGYEAGYDTRTLEADHELEDALKAQTIALLEKLPEHRDPSEMTKLTLVEGRPPHWADWNYGYNEGVTDVHSIIKEHLS